MDRGEMGKRCELAVRKRNKEGNRVNRSSSGEISDWIQEKRKNV